MSGEPTLNKAIHSVVEYRLSNLHTCLPGRVEKYDPETQKADVKPLLKRKFKDNTEIELPVIVNVPVVFPRSGGGSLTFPVVKGDGVLLLFSERSLDRWLSAGGDVAPDDRRKFDLSDAIAIPGLNPFTMDNLDPDGVNATLIFGDGKFVINPDGKIALGNSNQELMDLIDRLIAALVASVVPTGIGPQVLSKVTDGTIPQIATDWDEIKGSL